MAARGKMSWGNVPGRGGANVQIPWIDTILYSMRGRYWDWSVLQAADLWR